MEIRRRVISLLAATGMVLGVVTVVSAESDDITFGMFSAIAGACTLDINEDEGNGLNFGEWHFNGVTNVWDPPTVDGVRDTIDVMLTWGGECDEVTVTVGGFWREESDLEFDPPMIPGDEQFFGIDTAEITESESEGQLGVTLKGLPDDVMPGLYENGTVIIIITNSPDD